MNTSILLFLGVFIVWAITRIATWPLPELATRIFWSAVVVVAAIPLFLGKQADPRLGAVLLPLTGGLAAAEVLAVWAVHRWERFKITQAEKALAAQEAAKQARREARRAAKDQTDA